MPKRLSVICAVRLSSGHAFPGVVTNRKNLKEIPYFRTPHDMEAMSKAALDDSTAAKGKDRREQ